MKTATTGRRGFSFTEILFAVMILGIGFIMVAAMFPVAIQQTQNSTDETVGAGIARSGLDTMAQIAQLNWPADVPPNTVTNPAGFQTTSILTPTVAPVLQPAAFSPQQPGFFIYPPAAKTYIFTPPQTTVVIPGAVWSCCDFNDDGLDVTTSGPTGGGEHKHYQDLWSVVAPNMVQANDPRYAWVALWRRDLILSAGPPVTATPAPYAQVIVIACRVRNTQSYSAVAPSTSTMSDLSLQTNAGSPDATLVPSQGGATLGYNIPLQAGTISFAAGSNAAARAAEGAYVVIANDGFPLTNPLHGQLNGHVYRLGTNTGTNAWEFAPGEGPSASDASFIVNNPTSFVVFVVGMGQDPNNPTGPRSGAAQDIAVYSSFVPCLN